MLTCIIKHELPRVRDGLVIGLGHADGGALIDPLGVVLNSCSLPSGISILNLPSLSCVREGDGN